MEWVLAEVNVYFFKRRIVSKNDISCILFIGISFCNFRTFHNTDFNV